MSYKAGAQEISSRVVTSIGCGSDVNRILRVTSFERRILLNALVRAPMLRIAAYVTEILSNYIHVLKAEITYPRTIDEAIIIAFFAERFPT